MMNKIISAAIIRLFQLKIFAENMKSPKNGLLGKLASKIMTRANYGTVQHVVNSLAIQSNDCVLELGPGIDNILYIGTVISYNRFL